MDNYGTLEFEVIWFPCSEGGKVIWREWFPPDDFLGRWADDGGAVP